MLTGIKPPDALVRAAAVVNSEPDPLRPANKIHEAVGPQIAAILNKAMAQKPEDRYANANEFREALRRMGPAKKTAVEVESKDVGSVRVQPVLGTVHINGLTSARAMESPVVNMALVASARRFGPAGVTAVLAIVLTLAGGILYGSQRWLQSSDEVSTAAPATAAAVLRQSGTPRKSERPRTTDNISPAPAKLRSAAGANTHEQASEKRNVVEAQKSQPEKSPVVAAKPQAVFSRVVDSPSSVPRKNVRRPGAPTIRLRIPSLAITLPRLNLIRALAARLFLISAQKCLYPLRSPILILMPQPNGRVRYARVEAEDAKFRAIGCTVGLSHFGVYPG